jgi:hypothetical protein
MRRTERDRSEEGENCMEEQGNRQKAGNEKGGKKQN